MDAKVIGKLNRSKGSIKGSITKLENFITEKSASKDTNISELEVKLKKIENLQRKLDELSEQYYEISDIPNQSELDQDIEESNDRLERIEVSLRLLLNSIQNVSSQLNVSACVNESQNSNINSNIRLPEIPLPVFSGTYHDWANFKTQFVNLISNNSKLNDSQKLFYLRASLKGDAKHLESSDDTFDSLFKALEDRYENKRLLVESHVLAMLNYERLPHESAKELRSLIDCINKNIRALKVLEYDRDKLSDVMLTNIILQKLDKESRKQFEFSLKTSEVPKFDSLMTFLETRSATLESVNRNSSNFKPVAKFNHNVNKSKAFIVNSNKNQPKPCILCKNSHPLFKCITFQNMSICDRFEFVKHNNLCILCLRSHSGNCSSNLKCVFQGCKKPHNSLLHGSRDSETPAASNFSSDRKSNASPPSQIISSEDVKSRTQISAMAYAHKCVLLNTVLVYIKSNDGRKIRLRGLMDSASSLSLLAQDSAHKLGIELHRTKMNIVGINGGNLPVKYTTNTEISNVDESFIRNVEFAVVPKITDFIPTSRLDVSEIKIPHTIDLADPNFHIPARIDLLIGSDLFFEILKCERINTLNSNLILQNTEFGYIVTGSLPQLTEQSYCCLLNESSLDLTVKKFFEIESFPEDNRDLTKSEEELYCEEHFVKTYSRDETGRFIVQLPIKEKAESMLGHSKDYAIKRLNSICSKLDKNNNLAILYKEFMREYECLGHMEEIKIEDKCDFAYYIPHHAVYKPEKLSTPLRVVFNASSKTTTGYSLNSILLNGGIVQQDLFSLVTRFRTHRYAFSADVKKMFRQILIDPQQRDLQRIVWKETRDASVKVYRLRTVTYGTVSAPFLATRTLKALAEEEKEDFPKAAAVVCSDMYMDDVLTGAATKEECKELRSQLIQLLHRGGMELHKWVSNDPELLNDTSTSEYSFDDSSQENLVKTLGMLWQPQLDNLFFKVNISSQDVYSKRDVLSEIARLFDPLGLIGPVVTKAKIFLQGLWLMKLDWNQPLPPNIIQEWKRFLFKLPEVNKLQIPRYILTDDTIEIDLHGFADSSEKAYGAAVYIRGRNNSGRYITRLLCSKSRVSPIKPLTIPRLELCAALLLSRLVKKVVHILQLPIEKIWMWTDSTIVLAWLKTEPHKLKTFVRNRVAEIQVNGDNYLWNHVTSKDNPSDIISRGADPGELLDNHMWWHGPTFLQQEIVCPETVPHTLEDAYKLELKPVVTFTILNTKLEFFNTLFNCTNDFLKLIRICSYIYRFVNKLRHKEVKDQHLTSEELQISISLLVKFIQAEAFAAEIDALKGNRNISPTSKLKSLDPFLDGEGLLRVGGRLKNSNLPFEAKHQMILPSSHKFTKMLFEYFHKKHLHIGAQGLLHQVRLQYWPINGKSIARRVVHECLNCFKHKPKEVEQLMGDLPSERVNQSSPFQNSGVDFCGPFEIKFKNQRKGVFSKVYVAIFICLATKAIHMEIVSDLTSAAFIAALKRFCARRGKISTLISDNATNFKGAAAELKYLRNLCCSPDETMANYLTTESITWKFIPPRSPNFGGLWEAGVKSFKHHLRRTVGNSKLTLEEFETIVIQIEGILNSRPLLPLSDNINEFEVLTPGHFLVGRCISAIPEPEIIDISDNRLSRWQLTTKYVQIIWKRWHQDYLNHLQQRHNWQFKKENVKSGALVLLKEDNLPPYKWALARILKLIPGKDGKIRVVELKTANGVFRRCISKICLLPVKDNNI